MLLPCHFDFFFLFVSLLSILGHFLYGSFSFCIYTATIPCVSIVESGLEASSGVVTIVRNDRDLVYAVEGLTRLPAGWYRILRNVEKLTRPNNKCKYGDFDLSLLSTFGTTRDFPCHVDVTIIRCLILWKRDKQKNYICTLSISMNKKYYD